MVPHNQNELAIKIKKILCTFKLFSKGKFLKCPNYQEANLKEFCFPWQNECFRRNVSEKTLKNSKF